MGCSQSKMEKEEAVARCKDRHRFMKEAVSARNIFASAHSSYATYLNNTGAALTDFAAQFPASMAAPATANKPSYEIPLPPPPLPDFPAPLHRSSTMPEIMLIRPESSPVGTITEEEEEDLEEENRPPQQPSNYPVQPEYDDPAWEYLFPAVENMPGTALKDEKAVDHRYRAKMEVAAGKQPLEGKSVVKAKQNVNLIEVFTEVDDHFLKASKAAHEVSMLLEATRLHYHSDFADHRGRHVDYSARVMRVVTWNRSLAGIPNNNDMKDDFDSEEHETLAMVLDKLLVWEKKLYHEVKAAESKKIEYRRKVFEVNKLKKRGTDTEALEKAKAIASHLHTRCIVDMQSLESTISEINRLRDQLLYPRLVQIVEGMATMWGVMQAHHEQQLNIVMLLGSLDISQSPTETSEHHHDRTYQLQIVVQEWQSQFDKSINNQKEFIKALNNWFVLNLTIESDMGEKTSSPPSVKSPPIQLLLHAWHDHLEKLPEELASTAIANFVAVIDTILREQEEEMVLKRKCEDTRKEYTRKSKQFKEWEYKHNQKKRPDEFGSNSAEDNNDPDELVREKRLLVELMKKKLDEEEEDYARQRLHVRQKSLKSLQHHLPKLFKAMSDFSLECSKMYSELRSLSCNLSDHVKT